jgi:hypothetical protein
VLNLRVEVPFRQIPRYRIADPSFGEKSLGPELGDKPSEVRRKPHDRSGAKLRSVTLSELCSAVTLKTERWKGRAGHGERRQQTACLDLEMARWTFPAYGRWNVTTVEHGTGETLPDRGKNREKVTPISLRTKGREVRRESEGVVVLEDKDNITLSSPKGQGKGLYLSKASAQEVSARECL